MMQKARILSRNLIMITSRRNAGSLSIGCSSYIHFITIWNLQPVGVWIVREARVGLWDVSKLAGVEPNSATPSAGHIFARVMNSNTHRRYGWFLDWDSLGSTVRHPLAEQFQFYMGLYSIYLLTFLSGWTLFRPEHFSSNPSIASLRWLLFIVSLFRNFLHPIVYKGS